MSSDSKPVGDEKKYFRALNNIRERGIVNMFGAGPVLQQYHPGLSDKDARAVLMKWMSWFPGEEGDLEEMMLTFEEMLGRLRDLSGQEGREWGTRYFFEAYDSAFYEDLEIEMADDLASGAVKEDSSGNLFNENFVVNFMSNELVLTPLNTESVVVSVELTQRDLDMLKAGLENLKVWGDHKYDAAEFHDLETKLNGGE